MEGRARETIGFSKKINFPYDTPPACCGVIHFQVILGLTDIIGLIIFSHFSFEQKKADDKINEIFKIINADVIELGEKIG